MSQYTQNDPKRPHLPSVSIKQARKQSEKRQQKFFAWLGEINIANMTQEDLNHAQRLFNKGISAKQMIAELEKPYRRKP